MERIRHWLRRAEAQLDHWGRPAWIAAMVLGFILFVPLGLFILGYMIWSERMSCRNWKRSRRTPRGDTGNSAFDAYRRETLQRLEEERDSFMGFLDRLRDAKDRSEFEQFMTERKEGEAATA